MVRHVRIQPDRFNPRKPDAEPHKVIVKRDDQRIEWALAPEFCWAAGVAEPIQFLAAVGDYLAWPGTVPTPIGPITGGPDIRVYTADTNRILARQPGGVKTELYHYLYAVCPRDTPDCLITYVSDVQAPDEQRWKDERGRWHDPEVENESQP